MNRENSNHPCSPRRLTRRRSAPQITLLLASLVIASGACGDTGGDDRDETTNDSFVDNDFPIGRCAALSGMDTDTDTDTGGDESCGDEIGASSGEAWFEELEVTNRDHDDDEDGGPEDHDDNFDINLDDNFDDSLDNNFDNNLDDDFVE